MREYKKLIVMHKDGFFINKHSVITNPNVVVDFEHKRSKIKITIAQIGSKFYAGYSFTKNGNNEGCGSPCSTDWEHYKTEEDAIKSTIRVAKLWFKDQEFINKLNEFAFPSQMTLFG